MVAHSTQILKNITRCWKVKANQCNRWKLTQHLFNKLHLLSTPATVSVTSEWKNRRRMPGKYKRIRRRCERKHWVKVSQAVAIFVRNCFNWMPWRMKKEEKKRRNVTVLFILAATILVSGFLYSCSDFIFFSWWTYLPWKFHLMRLNMKHFTFHCFITPAVGGFFVWPHSSCSHSPRPPVNVWNAWKMHSGKYLDSSNSPRNVFRFFSFSLCWIFNPVKVASVHQSKQNLTRKKKLIIFEKIDCFQFSGFYQPLEGRKKNTFSQRTGKICLFCDT